MLAVPRRVVAAATALLTAMAIATPATAAAAPADPAAGCSPYSTLPCSAVTPSGPTALTFGADAGGVVDKAGVGTGFTAVQPNTAGDQYLPANLAVDTAAKQLVVTATPGIQYAKSPPSTGTNTQQNALGVGLRSAGARTTLTTTLVNPLGTNKNSEQAGLWFGPDQDNYVKLVVQANSSSAGVQLSKEVDGVVDTQSGQLPVGNPGGSIAAGAVVGLTLVLDANAKLTPSSAPGTVAGSYTVNGGAATNLGTLSVPASLFDGSKLTPAGDASGFGGIFTTTRRNPNPIDFHFNSFSATTAAKPAPPTALAATAASESVALSWSGSTGSTYSVYRSDSTPVDTTGTPLAVDVAETAYTDKSVTNGQTYHYAVTATNDIGSSGPSNEATATTKAPADTTAPAAPTDLKAAAGDARATLTWTANTEADLAGYNLYRSAGADPINTAGTPINGGTLITAATFDDTGLTNGTAYHYALVAVDTAGNASPASATADVTPKLALPNGQCAADQYKAEYFANTDESGTPATTRCDDAINNDYGTGAPAGTTVGPDNFSVRWSRTLTVPANGSYTFSSTADDSMVVALDGATVLDNGGAHGPETVRTDADLTTGEHALVVHYKEFTGGAVARFAVIPTPGSGGTTCTAGTYSAEYFDNINLSGAPVATRCEDAINTDYGSGHPQGVDVGDDNFSVRWTQVKAFSAGDYTFSTNSDDGSRVYVDGKAVIDNFFDHGPLAARQTIPLTADTHRVVVEYYERTGDAIMQFGETQVGAGTDCTASQYKAEYYNTNNFTGPVQTRCDAAIDNGYGTAGPDVTGIGTDNFSVRWTQVRTFTAGTYTFTSTSDDGMVVAVDGATVLDNGGAHGAQTKTAAVDLTAGTHTVVVSYVELTGDAVARFGITPPATDTTCAASQYAAEYFSTVNFSGTPVTQCDDAIDNDYGFAGPDVAGIGNDNFSVRWTQTKVYAAGDYTFMSTSDDGMTVALDGAALIDNGGTHGPQTKDVVRTLTAGEHTLVISYYERTGGATAKFSVAALTPQAPAAPTNLAATAGDAVVTLSWTPSPQATGYQVYRSTSGSPNTSGTPLNTDAVTDTTFTDNTVANGTTYTYVVTALNGAAESGASNEVTATPKAVEVHAKVNFQPAVAPTVPGYTVGNGRPYGTTPGQGWVRQDSLGTGPHTPLDLNSTGAHTATSDGNARDRNRTGINQLNDTFIHMQYGDILPAGGTNGNPTPGAYEYAVPNGTYTVTVAVGDQPSTSTGYDSVHQIHVEGRAAINQFQATAANEYKTATVTVPVNDGRLTIDAVGGTNTKLDYVTIDTAVPDATAPAAPAGVKATAGDANVSLSWTANTEADLAGYNVYRAAGTTAPATTAATRLNASPVTSPLYVDASAANGTAYTYVVTAVDASGNESPASAAVTATPKAVPAVHAKVNFSDADTAPPTGYTRDFGEAYGARTGSDETYGWIDAGNGAPVSLVGNGRNRNPAANQSDLRLATMLHMQLPDEVKTGVHTPGTWELAVPNGAYEVTVAAGDAGGAVDSEHWLNIENQNAIAAFVPTASSVFASATRTVVVADGKLTVTAASGTNTKIDYVTVDSVTGADQRPYVTGAPANLATGVDPTGGIVEDLQLPNGGVDPASLTTGSAGLTKVSDGSAVAVRLATSGGADTINVTSTAPLAANTAYRLFVTDQVKDVNGGKFLPYSVVFTTGAGGGPVAGPVAFDKAVSGAPSGFYTNMTKGPDGKMYAATIDGHIIRMAIAADGTLTKDLDITTVRDHATATGLYGAPDRSVIGLTFDPTSTAANPVLWISDNPEYKGQNNIPDFSSHIAKLTGANLDTYTDVLTNLPRSIKDHEVNSIAFGPDGALYFNVGAMNAMGEPDSTWGNRAEHLLSAATLRLDTAKLPAALPLDVKTTDVGGPYNPFAAGVPLTVYGSGIRNAFDLVWHSNGHLYVPTNGSAAGGNTPKTPSPLPGACTSTRPGGDYAGGNVPGITNNRVSQTDFVYDVKQGKYYGHPNPARCQWVLDNGNPTAGADPFQVDAYPVGTKADSNYDLAGTYDAGIHASADGAIEYKGNAFGGALKGKLLVVRYSDGQDIESFDVAASGTLSNRTPGIVGGLNQPLALFEDTATGNLYVSETGGTAKLTLLRPQGGGGTPTAQTSGRVVLNDVIGGSASAPKNATITNVGGAPLTVTKLEITADATDTKYGDHAAQFSVVNGPTLPATIPAGGKLEVSVAFNPSAIGPQGALLKVTTNDAKTPVSPVTLRGLGTKGLGGSNEPSLQGILDTEQIAVNSGTTDPTVNTMSSTAAAIGDEVLIPAFDKAEFDKPVTVTPVALFGPGGPGTDPNVVHVKAYDAATPATVQAILDGPNASNQALDPAAANVKDFDPAEPFGFSFTWPALGHTSFQADAANTWESNAAARHKVRVYPLKDAAGTVVPSAYVVAPEDITAPNVDYQDAVLIVRNVKPAAAAPVANKAVLSVSNLDGVPYPDRLVFSRIQAPADSKQLVHDVVKARISNTGTDPLTVSGLPITGKFELASPVTLPATVPAGGKLDIGVRFTATGGDLNTGTLTVQTDAGTGTTKVIELAGFWQSRSEGGQEPTVSEVFQTYGWKTNVPNDLNKDGAGVAQGDEVLSSFWRRADTTKPINVTQLAGYHSYANGATFKLQNTSGGNVSTFGMNNLSSQSLLPWAPGSTSTIAGASFASPPAQFGFAVDGESSVDTRNDGNKDRANGCVGTCGHHVLIFPVKDRTGVSVPNTYVLGMDYSGINYDYNDNLYLLTNITPETPQAPTGVTAAAGDNKVTLSWAAQQGVAGFEVFRGATANVATTGTPLSGATPISGTSFTDTTALNGTTYYYVVRAVSTGGTRSAASPAAAATPLAPGTFSAKVNFQPDASAAPAGYTKDSGAEYSATAGSGWVKPGTSIPVDMTKSTRDRGAPADSRLATLILMQGNGGATQPNVGAWERAVPNGRYQVTVGGGDAIYFDSTYTLNVEGVRAVDGFVPTAANPYVTKTVTVDVTDGKLTIDATGGTNTKLDYVDITAAP